MDVSWKLRMLLQLERAWCRLSTRRRIGASSLQPFVYQSIAHELRKRGAAFRLMSVNDANSAESRRTEDAKGNLRVVA